jgi:hypothetical protein
MAGGTSMEAQYDWVRNISAEIGDLKNRLSPSEIRKYKLPMLLRISDRVAEYCTECQQCRQFQDQITRLTENLKDTSPMTDTARKGHLKTIEFITQHLKKEHKLVEERHYLKRFVSIAVAGGISLIAFGYMMLNFGITLLVISITLPALFVRLIFGYILGFFMDRRAKKKGRVI